MAAMLSFNFGILSVLADISLGTWIGFIVTLVASIGLYIYRERRKRDKLRKALISELKEQNTEQVAKSVENSKSATPPNNSMEPRGFSPSELPPIGTLPTQVYTSNAGNIGILSQEEIDEIVSYYSRLLTQKSIIENIRAESEVTPADEVEIDNKADNLNKDRESLIDTLNEKVS